MTQKRGNPLCPARVLPTIALALLAVLASPTPAHALGDYAGVEGAAWFQGLDGNAAIDNGSSQGTLIDFKSDLGLENRDTSPAGRVWFRLGRSRLIFDYSSSARTGDGRFSQPVTFNGVTYNTSETIRSRYDLTLLQGQYRFTLLDAKLAEVGLGIGLNVAQIKIDLNGSTTGAASLDENVPYPTVNASVVVKPIPGLHIRAEANGLSVNVSGNKVQILDARVQVESYFLHSFGLFGGYRSYRFSVDASDYGHVENTFTGPYVGLGVKF